MRGPPGVALCSLFGQHFGPFGIGGDLVFFPVAVEPAIAAFACIKQIQFVAQYFPVRAVGAQQALAQAQRIGTVTIVGRGVALRICLE